MRIRVTGHSGEDCFPFGTGGPWKKFVDVLLEGGHEICEMDLNQPADALIANSHSRKFIEYCEQHNIPKERRILVLWEPYVVETTRYKEDVLENYGHVFAPSIIWAKTINATSFKWPQDAVEPTPKVFELWSARENSCVMLQGNKFSARKGELYSLRRKVLRNVRTHDLSLYGTNWNRGFGFDWWHWSRSALNSRVKDLKLGSGFGIGRKYKNYIGPVEDKQETLRKFKISVVIENSPDFVSEKLFDSVRAGCVTIYVGPSLREFGIPATAAIEMMPNAKQIAAAIRALQAQPEFALEEIAKNQNKSLQVISPEWENNVVLQKLAQEMIVRFSIKG